MKLSSPPKLVEKLVWVPAISFCKIFIHNYAFDGLLCRKGPFSPPNCVTLCITLLPSSSIIFDTLILLRPSLDEGSGSNLDLFEANWILEFESTLVVAWFSKSGALVLALFFGPNQLIFPPKQVSCRFSLNLPLFDLGSSSKGLGTNLKLLTNKIAWIHWSLDLGPSSKVTLIIYLHICKNILQLIVNYN